MRLASVALIAVLLIAPAWATSTVDEIRKAAQDAGTGPARPLPLAAHWNTGVRPDTFTPEYQLTLIDGGRHILPWLQFPEPGAAADDAQQLKYYEPVVRRLAELKLPFALVSTQWESLLSSPPYLDLPPKSNPNVILAADGRPQPAVSPFGPVEPWREVGRRWTESPLMRLLQQWYPDPPLVLLISNNEHPKLTWTRCEDDARYLSRYGKDRDGEFKRKLVGNAWVERYRALQQGMRGGLVSPAWKNAVRFIGYDAFGPSLLGRWSGWGEFSLHTSERVSAWPLAWDGTSSSFYTNNWDSSTDHTVWGPQVESQNWLFMLDEARRANPGFWFEMSTWDGNVPGADDKRKSYAARGQPLTPQRYGGMVQFGLWLLRPRVVREFRVWTDTVAEQGPYFEPILDAVDRVHADPVLREFWKTGRLVPNPGRRHPYQEEVPPAYANQDRWFALDTNLDAASPWNRGTEIPVFALALALGERPQRQWLLYAHSPLSIRKGVSVSIPDYGRVTIDVDPAGSFYVVRESDGRINQR